MSRCRNKFLGVEEILPMNEIWITTVLDILFNESMITGNIIHLRILGHRRFVLLLVVTQQTRLTRYLIDDKIQDIRVMKNNLNLNLPRVDEQNLIFHQSSSSVRVNNLVLMNCPPLVSRPSSYLAPAQQGQQKHNQPFPVPKPSHQSNS